ncbi:hypothetical protein ACIHAR_37275 [Streptomyces sp. NPDC052016]|uniref:hypothetical protein n=1 Tax=Streptomyces sp. NPDC052016 TaxID=3365680 RepID=UPI0037D5955F
MSAATVYTVTNAMWAGAQGIELKSVALELEGDVDLRGFLGSTPQSVGAWTRCASMYTPKHLRQPVKQLEGLVALVESRSPIRDTLASPVGVVTTLA